MNVWPFPPQRKLKETMEWMTEVIRCKSAEQRLCLRNVPRTSLEYDFQFLPQEIEAATVMARQWGADEFLIPLWHELSHVGTVSSSTTSIPVDTTLARYQAGWYAFIMGVDGKYEVVTIDSVTPTTIELVSPGVVLGFTGAVVMPCYPARFKSAFSFRKYAAEYTSGAAEFIITENLGITASNPYSAFNGSYVVSDRPLLGRGSRETQTREFEAFSNVSGPLFYSKPYTYSVGSNSISWSFDSQAELYAFMQWMLGVKGKQQSFYLPRWTRDFVPSQNVVSTNTHITVYTNDLLTDSYTGPICLVKSNGDQVYLIVESWLFVGSGQYRMRLTTTVGENIDLSDIEMITRMPKMRFNSDKVEFDHQGGKVVDVRMPTMEVPE